MFQFYLKQVGMSMARIQPTPRMSCGASSQARKRRARSPTMQHEVRILKKRKIDAIKTGMRNLQSVCNAICESSSEMNEIAQKCLKRLKVNQKLRNNIRQVKYITNVHLSE